MSGEVLAGPPTRVDLADLKVGEVLAEGGEGVVHQLPRQPHLVLKRYREPPDPAPLEDLVAWPAGLASAQRERLGRAAAWPAAVVSGPGGQAAGLLVPRAPRRFALRHRDAQRRLASLSYLTADPDQRAAAYGLALPPPLDPARLGLVYALALLLEVLDGADTPASHGDLSTKNVLWSLQRGPEVFVIDCDSCELHRDGTPASRRRAMTPNWNDPAVARGQNPTRATDRYSLGLAFLRIAGAANFPIQARQRTSERTEIAFPVPEGPASKVLLDPAAPVWSACGRALSVADPGGRPAPAEWAAILADLLVSSGAAAVAEGVRGAGVVAPGPLPVPPGAAAGAPDVVVTPVPAARRAPVRKTHAPAGRVLTVPAPAPPPPLPPAPGALSSTLSPGVAAPAAPPSGSAELRLLARRFARWWADLHVEAWRALRRRASSGGAARVLLACAVVDFVAVVLAGAAVALVVSPLVEG